MVFKAGESGNPNGRPGIRQDFITRAKILMEKYEVAEILEIVGDPKRFGKLPAFDGMMLKAMAEGVADGGDKSRNSFLDRILGKAAQYVEQKIEQTTTITVEDRRKQAKEESDELLATLASKNLGQRPTTH